MHGDDTGGLQLALPDWLSPARPSHHPGIPSGFNVGSHRRPTSVPAVQMDGSDMHDRPRTLLPVRVLEGESIPEGVPELLANAHVILLGYHVIPDQTATAQARDQFEDTASSKLETYTAILEEAGATVESQLVFTHDAQTTLDRITAEEDCLSVLIPNAAGQIENVFVAVRGTVGIDAFVQLIAGLFAPAQEAEGLSDRLRMILPLGRAAEPGVGITLYHVAGENETDEDVQTLLDAVASRLMAEGVPEAAIDTQIERGGNSQEMIVDAAADYDTIIMGESDPSVSTFLFGMTADQVAKQFLGPVFVVQHGEAAATAETTEE
jgi:nucleotide-binding universal stress UspA family protein